MAQKPESKFMTVTPELAEQWLGKNIRNRNVRNKKVEDFARDMKSGNWQVNGEAIKFSETGRMTDGQHRCLACVLSGVPFTTLVVFGVPEAAQHTMDQGTKRTLADAIRFRNPDTININILAAGIRGCYNWDRGARSTIVKSAPTNAEALEYLEQNPDLEGYTPLTAALGKQLGVPTSVGMAAIRAFQNIDPDDADAFFERLMSDEGHYRGNPIYALRKALMADRKAGDMGKTPAWKLAVIIKGWNKWRSGDEAYVIGFRAGGSNPERFPEPF